MKPHWRRRILAARLEPLPEDMAFEQDLRSQAPESAARRFNFVDLPAPSRPAPSGSKLTKSVYVGVTLSCRDTRSRLHLRLLKGRREISFLVTETRAWPALHRICYVVVPDYVVERKVDR